MDIFKSIQFLADTISYKWLNLNRQSYLGSAINFFIYDSIKIVILLAFINYLMAIIRYYFPTDKIRNMLTKRRWFGIDYFLAATLGVITPFCSCSSIPLFIGFLSAGIPLGVTFAFLISSPLINESSLVLFPAMFGLKIALIYNLLGILVSMLGGYLISRFEMERYVISRFLKRSTKKEVDIENKGEKPALINLVKYWHDDAIRITKEVFPYVLVGVAIGSLIHGFIPEELIAKYLSIRAWWVIPLAVILGAPLYANSVSVIPIIEVLTNKGIPLGTALAFMTSIVTLSLPQILILKKVMKWQLLGAFLGITVTSIILMGYLFNCIL